MVNVQILGYNYSMRHTIKLNGMTLEYFEAGTGEALFIIPGAFASWRLFESFINKLSKHYRVICLTLPGMGVSSSFNKIATFADYYQVTVDLINHLAPNQPISLIGHSLGGGVAIALCNQPDIKLRKVLVINPLVNRFKDVVARPVVGFTHMIYRQMLFFPKLPAREWFPIDMLNMVFKRPFEFLRLHLFIARFPGLQLEHRQNPQLTLVIDKTDKFVLPDYETQIKLAQPNVKIINSNWGGHNCFLYQPEFVYDQFLDCAAGNTSAD